MFEQRRSDATFFQGREKARPCKRNLPKCAFKMRKALIPVFDKDLRSWMDRYQVLGFYEERGCRWVSILKNALCQIPL